MVEYSKLSVEFILFFVLCQYYLMYCCWT